MSMTVRVGRSDEIE